MTLHVLHNWTFLLFSYIIFYLLAQVDGLSDDTKMETQRDIHQRATDELAENELETQIHLTFYLVN